MGGGECYNHTLGPYTAHSHDALSSKLLKNLLKNVCKYKKISFLPQYICNSF